MAKRLYTGYIPVEPVMKHVRPWIIKEDKRRGVYNGYGIPSTSEYLAEKLGVSIDLIYRWVKGQRDGMEFDHADALICEVNVWLWHVDPELNEIYRTFPLDFDAPKEKKKNFEHGTSQGYRYHRCRCKKCTNSHKDYMKKYRADKKKENLALKVIVEACSA